MFEYLRNEYNPNPRLVLEGTPPPRRSFVRDLPYSESLTLDIPRDAAELRARHSRKYWSKIRGYERKFREETGAALQLRVVSEEIELRPLLAQVREVFMQRWAGEYTSFVWTSERGFARYAEAMIDLARQGRAELVVLESKDRVLSYGYCLIEGGTYYFYHHASVTDDALRRFSIGKILVCKLVEDLVCHRRCETFDLMTGAAPYKLEWATARRPIYFRIAEQRTPSGIVRFASRLLFYRAKFYVQFSNPRARSAVRRLLLAVERLSGRRDVVRTA